MSLEEEAVRTLIEKKCDITTAESCTGGMIAAALVNVAGVSEIYKEGYITYSNEAKHRLLGVENEILEKYGAVSSIVAARMAEGAAKAAGTRASLASTGIAGPGGGTEEKPVGLVYIACHLDGKTQVAENRFCGSRLEIRQASVKKALELLLVCLKGQEERM